jgi:hypothetical protein
MQFNDSLKIVEVKIPKNTCHPGGNVQNSQNAPVWKCGVCGRVQCADRRSGAEIS